MNVPIASLAFVLVSWFMRVQMPKTTFREKMREMDWWYVILYLYGIAATFISFFFAMHRGNAFVITATTAMYVFALIILPLLTHPHRTIAITWGGVRYAWDSGAIVAPLVLGCLGIPLFFWFELNCAEYPTIPAEVVGNRTTVLTYCAVLVHGVCVRFFFTASLAFIVSLTGTILLILDHSDHYYGRDIRPAHILPGMFWRYCKRKRGEDVSTCESQNSYSIIDFRYTFFFHLSTVVHSCAVRHYRCHLDRGHRSL
jgi:uncharacterized membrane protein